MKNFFCLKLFALILSFAVTLPILAVDIKYLVVAEISHQDLINSIEYKPTIFHDFGEIIVLQADNDRLAELNLTGISYEILGILPDDYYLLTPRKDRQFEDKLFRNSITIDSSMEVLFEYRIDSRKQPANYIVRSSVDTISNYQNYSITPLSTPIQSPDDLNRTLEYDGSVLECHDLQGIVESINSDNIKRDIVHLQDYTTRYFLHPNRREISYWLKNKFLEIGFTEVRIDSFYIEQYNWGDFPPSWQYNVIATLSGSVYPDNYILLGGHYDSIIFDRYGDPMEIAPGADDNASGVAALLEIARVMKENNYQPKKSFKFIPFAAEEIGLFGSRDIAEKYFLSDMNIELLVNNDMIANKQKSDDWKLKIFPYSHHLYLSSLAEGLFNDYTSIEPVIGNVNNPASDSYSFHRFGYPSLFYHEYDFSDVYHSPDDTIEHCDVEYAAEITKGAALTMFYIDRIPAPATNHIIVDQGSGDGVFIVWDHQAPDDIKEYRIVVSYLDDDAVFHVLTETISTLEEVYVSGLDEGENYYFAISAINNDGFTSVTTETNYTPSSIPKTPSEFTVAAFRDRVELNWQPNPELDIAGYNIYRSNNEVIDEDPYISQHPDNYYTDYNLNENRYYYYAVSAIDNDGNESEPTDLLRTGLFSLDKGILIANATPSTETKSSFLFPSEADIFRFYDLNLAPYQTSYLHIKEDHELTIADVGFYSTVILFNDSLNKIKRNYSQVLQEYLDSGGNLVLSGFNPLLFFDISSDFDTGRSDLISDYLKIEDSFHHIGSYFSYAVAENAMFSDLAIDSHKVPTGNRIINVTAFLPLNQENVIFSYGSYYPPEQPSGSMIGSATGVMTDQAATLSFPLFYMNESDLRLFFQTILTEQFGEKPLDRKSLKTDKHVLINRVYPNPFNRQTTIGYYIEESGKTEINIYNTKGQRVRTLYERESTSGRNKILWNGKDDHNRKLSTGVYIVELKKRNRTDQKKVVLLK